MFKKSFIICVIYFVTTNISFGQRFDEEINVFAPNIEMLNEAIFRATNEMRQQYNLPDLIKDNLLQSVAESHANAMINQNFYSHNNPHNVKMRRLIDRLGYFEEGSLAYAKVAENIAHFDLLNINGKFCLKLLSNGNYWYFDCKTRKRIPIYTYKDLARTIVAAWMKSEGHRINILDPGLESLGAAVALSKQPYRTAQPPYVRVVQNFGKKFIE